MTDVIKVYYSIDECTNFFGYNNLAYYDRV